MAALTEGRNTVEILANVTHYTYGREVADGAVVYAGSIAAQNGSGKAVPASDTAGLVVLGRAEATVSNGEKVVIRTGVYLFDNGTSSEELTAADIGAAAYVLDDHTVGKVGGSNGIVAGIVVNVTAEGVAVEITPTARKAAGSLTSYTDTNTTYGNASAETAGLVKQAAAVADCVAAGAEPTSVETQLNAVLAALRTAGILATEASE